MRKVSYILIPLAIVSWALVGFLYLLPLVESRLIQNGFLTPTMGEGFLGEGVSVSVPTKPPPVAARFKRTLKQDILKLVNASAGIYSVYVGGLGSEPAVDINITRQFYAASLNKIPLLVALYQQLEAGNLSWETEVAYLKKDFELGEGSIQHGEFGDSYTVEELAWKMIKESDNAAKNMLLRTVGFMNIVKVLQEAGAGKTDFVENTTIPLDIVNILIYLDFQPFATEALALMTDTLFEDRLAAGLPEGTTFAHKIGSWPETGSYHDCGIVLDSFPYLICVLSEGATLAESKSTMQKIADLTYHSRL